MTEKITIEEIRESFINGQKKQMVEQIEEYGESKFFEEFTNDFILYHEYHGFLDDYTEDWALEVIKITRAYFLLKY